MLIKASSNIVTPGLKLLRLFHISVEKLELVKINATLRNRNDFCLLKFLIELIVIWLMIG